MRSSTQTLSRTRRNRRRAQCAKRRPLGSEGGCAEKAGIHNLKPGPRRAAHPVHEQIATTNIYLHADMTLKENAIAKVTPPATAAQGRYKPTDLVLAFLAAL